jgi:hypothetical protein
MSKYLENFWSASPRQWKEIINEASKPVGCARMLAIAFQYKVECWEIIKEIKKIETAFDQDELQKEAMTRMNNLGKLRLKQFKEFSSGSKILFNRNFNMYTNKLSQFIVNTPGEIIDCLKVLSTKEPTPNPVFPVVNETDNYETEFSIFISDYFED